jgi:hypothetical protein
VWTLRIGGQPIAGRWIIIDRQFKPVGSSAHKKIRDFGEPGLR